MCFFANLFQQLSVVLHLSLVLLLKKQYEVRIKNNGGAVYEQVSGPV